MTWRCVALGAWLAVGCNGDGAAEGEASGTETEADDDDDSEGSGSTAAGSEGSTGGPGGCDDFAACEGGLCLGGECVPVPPCEGAACSVGPRGPLPDTNLRVCYGASPDGADGTIACPGDAGGDACGSTDYCGGDAQYGWDVDNPANARFTVMAGAEPVVIDEVTGLQWQGCVLGQTGPDCSGEGERVDWYTAQATCEDGTWGGFDDWTLPDAFALQSIFDYGTTSPAIDTSAFANAPSHFAEDGDQWWIECQWTGSDWAGDSEVAWAVMVNNGDVSSGSGIDYHTHDKGAEGWEGCYVRCVREPPPRTLQRWVRIEPAAGEPVVADTATQLMWQGCSAGQTGADCSGAAAMEPWKDALSLCEDLAWGGYDDWRLPNVKELRSIVDQSTQLPAVDAASFPNIPFYGKDGDTTENIGQYWSSTARSYNSFALYVDLGFGFSHFYTQDEGRHVLCVR